MKTTQLLALLLLLQLPAFGQDLFPTLYIDSLYREEIEEVAFDGNHSYDIFYAGYSYEADTVLVQTREPKRRIQYVYNGDSIVTEIMERRTQDGSWELERRKRNVYDDTLLLNTLIVTWEDGDWVNNTYESYNYDQHGLDTLKLVRKWIDGAWKKHLRRERTYTPQGNLISTAFYTANQSGNFQYTFGALYAYDNTGNRTMETRLSSSMSGITPTLERAWSYNAQSRIDTFTQCEYDTGVCIPSHLQVYTYQLDSFSRDSYTWFYDDWEFTGVEIFFEGPMLYSFEPDSILTYLYNFELGTQSLVQREYFSYTELPDNRLYYLHEIETFNTDFGFWVKTLFEEKWYHLSPEEPSSLNRPHTLPERMHLYPNPVTAGTQMQVELPPQTQEIRLFDILGNLVQQKIRSQENPINLTAPHVPGTYLVAAFSDNKPISIQKLIVQE